MSESNFTGNTEKEMTEKGYRARIGNWVKRTPYKNFYEDIRTHIIGQDDALADACLEIYNYLEKMSEGKHNKNAVLITAPSGNGKSFFYEKIQDYFSQHLSFLPVYQVDCSTLSETGYKGAEPISITEGLFKTPYLDGLGIVFLDEADKKIMPSYSSHDENINVKVQQGLLTAIEGCIIRGEPDKDSKPKQIRTDNTLFVLLGAFTELRETKALQSTPRHLGFSSKPEPTQISHYEDITREDLIECGGCYEFVGRISRIINFHTLSEDAVRSIINSMLKDESDNIGIKIQIDESSVQELIKDSNSKFGCRLLRSKIHDRTMTVYKQIKLNYAYADINCIILSEDGDKIIFNQNICEQPYRRNCLFSVQEKI